MALEALGFLFISLLASVYTLRLAVALALALDGGWVGHIKTPLVEYSRAVVDGLGAVMLMIMLGSCVFAGRTWCLALVQFRASST